MACSTRTFFFPILSWFTVNVHSLAIPCIYVSCVCVFGSDTLVVCSVWPSTPAISGAHVLVAESEEESGLSSGSQASADRAGLG